MSEGETYTVPPGMRILDRQGVAHNPLAPSGGGSGAGIGALVEVSLLNLVDGVELPLSLDPADPDHVLYYHRSGLGLNEANDGFVVTTAGRYRVSGYVVIREHPTAVLYVAAGTADVGGGNYGRAVIQPAATNQPINVPIPGYEVEYAEGATIAFSVTVTGANRLLQDSYWSVQYAGPATGIAP